MPFKRQVTIALASASEGGTQAPPGGSHAVAGPRRQGPSFRLVELDDLGDRGNHVWTDRGEPLLDDRRQ